LLAFGDAGRAWVEALAGAAGITLAEAGAVTLAAREDRLVEAKTPARIAGQTETQWLQLSADVRIAFTRAAEQLDIDEDGDDF